MTEQITVVRTFDAPRELVYSTLVTPEHFAVWFGTEAVDVPLETLSLDARVGGEWKAVMHLPDGSRKHWVGEYLEVAPPERLVFTITDEPENPDRSPVSFTLRDVDGGTELTLTQAVPGWTEEQKQGLTAGYGAFLDTMEALVSRIG